MRRVADALIAALADAGVEVIFGVPGGANVPLVMSVGVREGLLADGDVVGIFTGAAGMTCAAAVLRWGAG